MPKLKTYTHKAWGYCSKCGFGSCEHLQSDKSEQAYWNKELKKLNKVLKQRKRGSHERCA